MFLVRRVEDPQKLEKHQEEHLGGDLKDTLEKILSTVSTYFNKIG